MTAQSDEGAAPDARTPRTAAGLFALMWSIGPLGQMAAVVLLGGALILAFLALCTVGIIVMQTVVLLAGLDLQTRLITVAGIVGAAGLLSGLAVVRRLARGRVPQARAGRTHSDHRSNHPPESSS